MEGKRIITVLEEQDEFPHEPDDVTNYNESMYLNTFDLDQEIGGWFRLGNRVNEGYAEMTVCLYLPNGQIGFMYDRPKITKNVQDMYHKELKYTMAKVNITKSERTMSLRVKRCVRSLVRLHI